MTSQLNNPNEKQDQVLQETESMRPLFFENSLKHTPPPLQDPPQRLRLDSAVDPQQIIANQSGAPDGSQHILTSLTPSETTLLDMDDPEIAHTHLILRHHPHLLPQPLLAVPAGQGDSVVLTVMPSAEQVGNGAHAAHAAHFLGVKQRKNSSPRASHLVKKPVRLPLNHHHLGAALAALKTPKLYRRFRSRSLPIINYTLRSQISQPQPFGRSTGTQPSTGVPMGMAEDSKPDTLMATSSSLASKPLNRDHHALYRHIPSFNVAPSLPPINLQSLKEIDLQEILKNPQLRHDILFDPQLQFRPNLDGERGRRKKSVIKRYWVEIELECKQFFDAPKTSSTASSGASSVPKLTRLRALFTTLREILLSLLPMKDRSPVNEIMDIDLIVQQLVYGLFDFVAMAKWLGDVFKSHCAPMRDLWVLDMIAKFQQAFDEACVSKLVEGLRLIFSILEAMKLDVANHQIRILRPVLIETATDFEKDYFQQLITHCKIDILDSLKWFERGYHKRLVAGAEIGSDMKSVLTTLVIELLLCRNMATEFPLTLAFDHTRLVLLRADVRQLVCVQLCIVLFKQVSMNYAASKNIRPVAFKPELITRVQEQILAIVTDDNGNVKWTRNVQAIALQLVKNAVQGNAIATSDVNGDSDILLAPVPQHLVDFCYNWLIKQIQPNTDVYGLMEEKIFKELSEQVGQLRHSDNGGVSGVAGGQAAIYAASDASKAGSNVLKQRKADSEMSGILFRILTLVKFHWSVFGDYYTEYVRLQTPA